MTLNFKKNDKIIAAAPIGCIILAWCFSVCMTGGGFVLALFLVKWVFHL